MLYARQYAGLNMAGFNLNLLAGNQEQRFNDVVSFVGEDASGSFGLQAHHAYFMTVLVFGLARFRTETGTWHYLALPGGLVSFKANQLTLSTRYFLIDTDFDRMSQALEEMARQEQKNLRLTRDSLQRMEFAVLQRVKALKSKPEWQA
jgi:F-type H+-transporting ATPase subunit epsilon